MFGELFFFREEAHVPRFGATLNARTCGNRLLSCSLLGALLLPAHIINTSSDCRTPWVCLRVGLTCAYFSRITCVPSRSELYIGNTSPDMTDIVLKDFLGSTMQKVGMIRSSHGVGEMF